MIASNPTESLRRPYETVAPPDQVPPYDCVLFRGPDGDSLEQYRSASNQDAQRVGESGDLLS
jgi:hypothetical protein